MRRTSYDYESRSSLGANLASILEGTTVTVLLLFLLVAALLLPPVRLLDRIPYLAYTPVDSNGATISEPDGTALVFPPENVLEPFRILLSSIPRAEFLNDSAQEEWAAMKAALPDSLQPKSPIYEVDVQGGRVTQSIVQIPIPNDSEPYETLELYTWDGNSWVFMPSSVRPADDRIVASIHGLPPQNFVVMQTAASLPQVEANIGMREQLPPNAENAITTLAVAGFYLRGDGALEIAAHNRPNDSYTLVPILRNWRSGEVPRTDLLHNMLVDLSLQENQLISIPDLLMTNRYPGVIIDYQGVGTEPQVQQDFVRFIERLAERLHAPEVNRWLAVRVEPPQQISAVQWNTQGYDWQALGKAADRIIIPSPMDPRAYQPGGAMEALLAFATDQIDRRKVQIELSGLSVEQLGSSLLPKGYQEALQPFVAQIQVDREVLIPGEMVVLSVDTARISRALGFDEATGTYVYSYIDDQQFERTVYIENQSSFAHKLSLLAPYKVTQVMIGGMESGDVDPALWDIVRQFQEGQGPVADMATFEMAYTVFHPSDSVLHSELRSIGDPDYTSRPQEAREFTFTAPDGQGAVKVAVQVVQNKQPVSPRNLITLPLATLTPVVIPTSTPVPMPTPTSTPESASVVSELLINIRQGPSTNYTILGQMTPNQRYLIVGKNEGNDWWQIATEDVQGGKGWVFGELVTANGPLDSVATITDIPPPPTPTAAPPPAPAPAPSTGGSFGYGVQAHMVHTGDHMIDLVMDRTQELGFGWVKQQIEWKVFESQQGQYGFGDIHPIVNRANARGINLLFSVVNAPDWAREPGFDGSVGGPPANPQVFANFLGRLASEFCGSAVKAIEVWNEQNLHYEWGNRPINPSEYMALLRPSYAAIKSACPSMLVISGALTPAGDNGSIAMDDFRYFEAMLQQGLRNYADGFGAHPSGYNVPPSHTWQTACAAIQANGNSFNGACDNPHHSWSFRSTMEGYRNLAVRYGAGGQRIWPTEFGWAAGGKFHPAYAYADDNSYDEQARWTVEAYQMMRDWGWVGPAFLWNLNFRVVADGTEKAQWGIVRNDWSPLPVFYALRDMPK